MPLLTATYDADHKRIVATFYADGSVELATLGDVADCDLLAVSNAQGGLVAGWECTEIC